MFDPLDNLFNSDEYAPRRSRPWNREVFKRAYLYDSGHFADVCRRLELGFSVLVYLPGNCMNAAAEIARTQVNGYSWKELGKPSSNELTVADMWRQSASIFDQIQAWLNNASNEQLGVIFHNLNLLSDERGGLYPSNEAKTALLYLIEGTHSGVVLGLSDRNAGELPKAIRQIFNEEIWLDEIPHERFPSLIPYTLGQRLQASRTNLTVATTAIAARLRWTDPIRAVTIMESVTKQAPNGNLNDILASIMHTTRTVEFFNSEQVTEVEVDSAGEPTGFEATTIQLIKSSIIQPYEDWTGFNPNQPSEPNLSERLPPGLILYGPPGTGKTRLARWIAKSIGLPVRLVSAADLRRADYGESERLVKALFRSALRSAPCVIVLDDADDLLPDRDKAGGSVASAERGIVNAFLQELEGWEGRANGVLVILTTNRRDTLDPAVRSRLHLHVRVPYPLDYHQVDQIVESVAQSYGLLIDYTVPEQGKTFRQLLVDHFMGPQSGQSNYNIENREIRRNLENNLYSPREIAAAMRILIGHKHNRPEFTDFERMKTYLEQRNAVSLFDN
jgi:hypothetical protein